MFHSNTQQMIDYWRSKSGVAGLPSRRDIDPSEFAKLAPHTFVLGREASGVYPVRLAGGLISELHQRDLRGRNFLTLLDPLGRLEVQTALETARRRPEPVVARIDALSETATLDLELLIAPIAGGPGSPERFLGLYQPISLVAALHEEPLRQLVVRDVRGVGPANEETHRLRLATLDGRWVA
ncbi:hypothetical protein ASE17_15515 [Phenylobacterium sp. Root77]|jgi:hypothetical protein|uniref:PAS domain-containing protein n=1 Tax=unclassified Phenylobacterium TaxID=2640670 RepID=UPI0006F6AC41|nr:MULTISPECIES: PAS domain-containing protein [unclassified Phenylobacterium]KQW70314.1 hypothetical protein ASC73_09395 [Phenylobacterium sp. Root1277]KQW91265.1 hypothetical protein ASC79_18195 [Phenylobacterium sp. Root1290]KRC39098.1 hypothetical protein ASE17_15515 [Phenylobacterium sp. Root77]